MSNAAKFCERSAESDNGDALQVRAAGGHGDHVISALRPEQETLRISQKSGNENKYELILTIQLLSRRKGYLRTLLTAILRKRKTLAARVWTRVLWSPHSSSFRLLQLNTTPNQLVALRSSGRSLGLQPAAQPEWGGGAGAGWNMRVPQKQDRTSGRGQHSCLAGLVVVESPSLCSCFAHVDLVDADIKPATGWDLHGDFYHRAVTFIWVLLRSLISQNKHRHTKPIWVLLAGPDVEPGRCPDLTAASFLPIMPCCGRTDVFAPSAAASSEDRVCCPSSRWLQVSGSVTEANVPQQRELTPARKPLDSLLFIELELEEPGEEPKLRAAPPAHTPNTNTSQSRGEGEKVGQKHQKQAQRRLRSNG